MRGALRIFLLAGSLLCTVWVLWSVKSAFHSTPDQVNLVRYENYEKYRLSAVDMRREDIKGFAEIGLLLMGGLWGVALVNKDSRLRLKDWPEIVTFLCATGLLALLIFFNYEYRGVVERLYWDLGQLLDKENKIIDTFDSQYIQLHYQAVMYCFYGGLGTSAACVFSLCLLRDTERLP